MEIKRLLILICSYMIAAYAYTQDKTVVVSADKQNILYVGIDNPLSIAIPGIPCSQTFATMNNGKLSGKGCKYIARPKDTGQTTIHIYSIVKRDSTFYTLTGIGTDSNGNTITDTSRTIITITDTMIAGKIIFTAKPLPDPVVYVSGKRNESVSKGWLMVQKGPYASTENLQLDVKYKITSFRIKHYSSNKEMKDIYIKGTLFNMDVQDMFNSGFRGDIFRIFDIKAIGPDGAEIELEPIELYVEEKF